MAKQKQRRNPEMMTVAEAARELRSSVTQVYRWLDEERLDEFEVQGHIRLVLSDSVAELKAKREAE